MKIVTIQSVGIAPQKNAVLEAFKNLKPDEALELETAAEYRHFLNAKTNHSKGLTVETRVKGNSVIVLKRKH